MADSTEILNIKEEKIAVKEICTVLLKTDAEENEEAKTSTEIIENEKIHTINVFPEDHSSSTPISPVKAVLLSSSNENETLLSDDENKVMFTLEPPTKPDQQPSVESDDIQIEIDEVEIDEIEEEEDCNETHEDINDYINESEQVNECTTEFQVTILEPPSETEISDIAKKQLDSLNKNKKITKKVIETLPKLINNRNISITVVDKAGNSTRSLPCYVLGRDKNNPELDFQSNGREATKSRPGVKFPRLHLSSPILSAEDLNQEITKKFKVKSPIRIIEDRILSKNDLEQSLKNDSDIEIPTELILSSEVTPIILNEQSSSLKNQDLIDILEGNDDEIGLEISPAKTSPKKIIDKELEKEIALRQIMNLPGKTRGRKPKPKPIATPKKVKADKVVKVEKIVKAETQSLVDALVSDWSDNESKNDDSAVVDIKSENISPAGNKLKRKIVAAPKSTIKIAEVDDVPIKRSRVIKKKIIWDPDAPESKVSFASLVKKETPKDDKKNIPDLIQINEVKPTAAMKRETPGGRSTPNTIKKKKLSEIDKLLGDEGAVNMIYSLERENNNSDVPEIETKPNKNSLIDKTKEKKDLVTRTKAIRNAVIKQSNTSEDVSVNRPRAKRETPVKVIPVKITNPKKKSISRESLNSENWDYVYSQQKDDAMIIRRRSNSSYSSSSPRRLSVDVQQMSQEDLNSYGVGNDSPSADSATSSSSKKGKGKTFEFVKPNNKKQAKADSSNEISVGSDLKGKITKAIGKMISPPTNRRSTRADTDVVKEISPFKKFEKIEESNDYDNTTFKTIALKTMDGIVQIIFTSTTTRLENVFTAECMKEISDVLEKIEEDDSIKVAILSSSSNDFCKGLDFTTLLQLTKEKKISAATELVSNVK